MARIAIPIWLLTASVASAQETTVWITIAGRGGAEEVEIGPEGGLVPYQLFVETDPLGTPGNLGLWSVEITIDTDLGAQQAAPQLDPAFESFFSGPRGVTASGEVINPDDVTRIGGTFACSSNGRLLCRAELGIGQSGPQPVARGKFLVAAAPVGSPFHAKIVLETTESLFGTAAEVITSLAERRVFHSSPDRIAANVLTITVVANPQAPADLDRDGDVDLSDFLDLMQCAQGPENAVAQECEKADLDWDGDVDLADIVAFIAAFTGSR